MAEPFTDERARDSPPDANRSRATPARIVPRPGRFKRDHHELDDARSGDVSRASTGRRLSTAPRLYPPGLPGPCRHDAGAAGNHATAGARTPDPVNPPPAAQPAPAAQPNGNGNGNGCDPCKEEEKPEDEPWALMRCLKGHCFGERMAECGWSILGWTQGNYTLGNRGPSNLPITFNDRGDFWQMNQNFLRIDKAIDTSKKEFQWGGRTEWILPGTDARFTPAREPVRRPDGRLPHRPVPGVRRCLHSRRWAGGHDLPLR